MYRWAVSKLDFVTTPSQNAKDQWAEVENIPYDKIQVIYNGVKCPENTSKTQSSNKGDNQYLNILISATLSNRKGHHDLFDAFSKSDYLKGLCFIDVAGDGPLREQLKRRVQELAIHSNVRFWGFQTDMDSFYSEADMLCLPSFKENFPWVLLEAMSFRVPVIATNIAGIPEMIDHGGNGLLFEAGDGTRLKEHLEKLSSNSDLRQKLGEKGYQTVKQNFTVERMAQETYQVYEQLLNE
jgi:glycosyltransferase involved in cell wall biosynthesis